MMILSLITTATAAECAQAGAVKLNEFVYATGVEWVELYNPTGAEVPIAGWVLEFGTKGWGEGKQFTIPDGAVIGGEGFYVIGASGAAVKDTDAGDLSEMGNASSGDGVRLTCADGAYDTVVYSSGSSNGDGITDENDVVWTVVAPDNASGLSTGRVPDGEDATGQGDDWHETVPTPGAANVADDGGGDTGEDTGNTSEAVCDGWQDVVINEFNANSDEEWVELYNASESVTANLAGWRIEYGTSSYSKDETFGDYLLTPGSHFVIASATAAVAAHQLLDHQMDLGNGTDVDAMRLVCGDDVADTVLYGKGGGDVVWTQDDGAEAVSFAPMPSKGGSSARRADGQDTDDSGKDFAETDIPTPGGENPELICVAGDPNIKLNEVLYDPDGTDGANDWVEIFNAGDDAVRVDGWVIQVATQEFKDEFAFPYNTSIAAGEFLTVSGGGLAGGSFSADGFSIGNGSDGDGVRLTDCEGNAMDTVLYGDELAAESGLRGDDGSSDVVAKVPSAYSIGRSPDGADTDSIDDWGVYPVPTPGAPNGDPESGGGGASPGGCDCQKGPGQSDSPGSSGGCITAPLPLGGLELALAAFVIRRRSRR